MPNVSTLAFAQELPGAAQGASSTSEIQFKNLTAANAVISVNGAVLKNAQFILRAAGRAVGGTTTNLTIKLYDGAALGSIIFTSGAIAVNSSLLTGSSKQYCWPIRFPRNFRVLRTAR
jgi:trimethylamine:corrinoid methyltransferase-like protein